MAVVRLCSIRVVLQASLTSMEGPKMVYYLVRIHLHLELNYNRAAKLSAL
jgi:hypothetical protein